MQRILSVQEIRNWDSYTITHEPISSTQLMERAAYICSLKIISLFPKPISIHLFCGNGNNGGDGWVIARNLVDKGYTVHVWCDTDDKVSKDNKIQREKSSAYTQLQIHSLDDEFLCDESALVIDALFGSGVEKALQGKATDWITKLNQLPNTIISIDMPSGLPCDILPNDAFIVNATYTLSFQCYKKTFLFPESGKYCGTINILDIGLLPEYLNTIHINKIIPDNELIKDLFIKRNRFSHKGNFGHSLLYAGSKGKMGAAVLATKACLRSGSGLTTAFVPDTEMQILQISCPEAMCSTYSIPSTMPSLGIYTAIAAGCGIGLDENALYLLKSLLAQVHHPIILDADALHLLALHPHLIEQIPEGSVITPHVKEFDRLFGACSTSLQRYEIQKQKSRELNIIIVLKGSYTTISTPGGLSYFNTTGNAGLAKGGSGDVLCGMICGFYAQYKDMCKAALLAVYIHGVAADIALKKQGSYESIIACDVIECIGSAISSLEHTS